MGIKSTLSLKAISTEKKDTNMQLKAAKNETAVHISQINEPVGFKIKDKSENKVGLVKPPKQAQKEKTPLIVEHRDDFHDLKTFYNPEIKPNPHEYSQKNSTYNSHDLDGLVHEPSDKQYSVETQMKHPLIIENAHDWHGSVDDNMQHYNPDKYSASGARAQKNLSTFPSLTDSNNTVKASIPPALHQSEQKANSEKFEKQKEMKLVSANLQEARPIQAGIKSSIKLKSVDTVKPTDQKINNKLAVNQTKAAV